MTQNQENSFEELFSYLRYQRWINQFQGQMVDIVCSDGGDDIRFSGRMYNYDPTENKIYVYIESKRTLRSFSVNLLLSISLALDNDSDEEEWEELEKDIVANRGRSKYATEVQYEVESKMHHSLEACFLVSKVVLGPYPRGFKYSRNHRKSVKKREKESEAIPFDSSFERDLRLEENGIRVINFLLEPKDEDDFELISMDLPNQLPKNYWDQRFRLFQHFDKGIRLDYESFFSVTPERIAEHIALRCDRESLIVDLFSGCGGNSIQFAKICKFCISVEMDANKVNFARSNAKIYRVEKQIEFVQNDVLSFLQMMKATKQKADVIFLSPPWGGPSYKECAVFDLKTCLIGDVSLLEMIERCLELCSKVACFLPRNVSLVQLESIATNLNVRVELEKHIVSKRVKTCCCYCGDFESF